MRRYATEAEMAYIPNANFKRNAICQNYMQFCNDTDIQGCLSEQLDANPKLLAWLFDDSSLVGKSYLALSPERLEAFQDFYNSFDIYDEF